MIENKLETINNIFEGNEIRSIWDSENEDYYFIVVDVIGALTESNDSRKYWSILKNRLKKEGSELTTKCSQLKMKSSKDGKNYLTDVLDTEGIFRLIESVPSPKAEPFKLWLAKLARQEVDNVFDPSKGIDKMLDYYLKKGYTLEWIEARVKAIINRKKLTSTWKENGIEENFEYGILTNEIYINWSGMNAREYKAYKGIRKESLRDNMTDIEVLLTDLGESATRDIAKSEHPQEFKENMKVAKKGGQFANDAKKSYEKSTKKKAISNQNTLNYQYIDDTKQIENKNAF